MLMLVQKPKNWQPTWINMMTTLCRSLTDSFYNVKSTWLVAYLRSALIGFPLSRSFLRVVIVPWNCMHTLVSKTVVFGERAAHHILSSYYIHTCKNWALETIQHTYKTPTRKCFHAHAHIEIIAVQCILMNDHIVNQKGKQQEWYYKR